MKTLTTICVSALLVFMLPISSEAAPYYYSGGEQTPLKVDSNRMLIKFDSDVGLDNQGALIASIGRIGAVEPDNHTIDGFLVCSLSSVAGYDTFLDSAQAVG